MTDPTDDLLIDHLFVRWRGVKSLIDEYASDAAYSDEMAREIEKLRSIQMECATEIATLTPSSISGYAKQGRLVAWMTTVVGRH